MKTVLVSGCNGFIGQNLVNKMDDLNLCERNIESVIVENQPSLKNPTMKSIQMMVYSYFLIILLVPQLLPTLEYCLLGNHHHSKHNSYHHLAFLQVVYKQNYLHLQQSNRIVEVPKIYHHLVNNGIQYLHNYLLS